MRPIGNALPITSSLAPVTYFIVSKGMALAYLTSIADVFAVLLFLATIRAIRDYRRRGGLPHPPGPRPLPIIGNLLDVPKRSSWLTYTKFVKTHGSHSSFAVILF